MGGNPPALKLPPSPRLRGDKMGDKTGDKQARGGGQRRRRGEWLMDVGLWSGHQPSSTNHEPIRGREETDPLRIITHWTDQCFTTKI